MRFLRKKGEIMVCPLLLRWRASPFLKEPKIKIKIEKGCDYYGRNKDKDSGQVPHCNYSQHSDKHLLSRPEIISNNSPKWR